MEIMKNDQKADEDQVLHLPFPPRLVSLYRQLEESTDPEERYMLSREMAEIFSADHDPTDHQLTDSYHEYFEEFDKAKLAYDQAALKVARVATQVIDQYLVSKNMSTDDLCDPVPDRSSN